MNSVCSPSVNGALTANAVKAFEKIHPNIKVTILSLSPTSDVAEQQLEHYFIAGSATPDVVVPVCFPLPVGS